MHSRIWRFGRGIVVVLVLLILGACNSTTGGVAPTVAPAGATLTETLAPTSGPTPTVTTTALLPQNTATFTATAPPMGTIQGAVWEDRCPSEVASPEQAAAVPCRLLPDGTSLGDGQRQPEEPALAGVIVRLAQGPCPGTLLSKTATDARGVYAFKGLPPGRYCVSIDDQEPLNQPLLSPGVWTQPGVGQGQQVVILSPNETVEVNFARTLQRAEQAQAVTPTLGPTLPPSATPTFAPTSTMTPIPTPTLTDAQKPYALGEPQMHDPMNTPGAHWFIFNSFPWASVQPANGKLLVTIFEPDPTHNLWIRSTYPALKDAYLEAVFQTGKACNHKDRYGLVVRSPSKYEGVVFVVSCDAMYKIYRWNGGFTLYRNWTHATMVHPGPNQTNRIGVWMEGNTLKLYINRAYVDEVEENLFTEGGFALMVGGGATSGFQVAIDEVNYWTELP